MATEKPSISSAYNQAPEPGGLAGVFYRIETLRLPRLRMPGYSFLNTVYFSAATVAPFYGAAWFPARFGAAGAVAGAALGFLASLVPLALLALFNARAAWRTLGFLALWWGAIGLCWSIILFKGPGEPSQYGAGPFFEAFRDPSQWSLKPVLDGLGHILADLHLVVQRFREAP